MNISDLDEMNVGPGSAGHFIVALLVAWRDGRYDEVRANLDPDYAHDPAQIGDPRFGQLGFLLTPQWGLLAATDLRPNGDEIVTWAANPEPESTDLITNLPTTGMRAVQFTCRFHEGIGWGLVGIRGYGITQEDTEQAPPPR